MYASNHHRNILSKGDSITNSKAVSEARSTAENIQAGIDGKVFEINEMYPVYIAVATSQSEKGTEVSFTWAFEAEKIHAGLYQKAKQAVDEEEDVDLGPIQICSVSGYTVEGAAPERCPICKALKEQFGQF